MFHSFRCTDGCLDDGGRRGALPAGPAADVALAARPATAKTVARTLSDRAVDHYRVPDFSDRGDGSTDDSVAIGNLRSLASDKGGTIWLPGGHTYKPAQGQSALSSVPPAFVETCG